MHFEPAVEFLKNCIGKTALVHHGDADGCCSAAITAICLHKLHGHLPELFSPTRGGSRLIQELVDQLKNFDNIIIQDLGEKNAELIAQIEDKKVYWLDHHKDTAPLQAKILYINPHYWSKEEDIPPTSYLAYQVASLLFDVSNICWLAAVGVIGDKEEDLCADVIEQTFKLYPNLEGGSMGRLEILKYIVGWISSGRSYSGGEGAIVSTRALIEAGMRNNPALVFEGTSYADKVAEFVDATKKRIKEIFEQSTIQTVGNAVICEIDVKSYIQNYLAGILRGKYPRKVIIVANFGLHDDLVQIELRRTSEIDVSLRELARNAVIGMEASAGGHPEAAGIRIPKEKWPEFKTKILSILESSQPGKKESEKNPKKEQKQL